MKRYLTTILLVIAIVSTANEKHSDSSEYLDFLNKNKIDSDELKPLVEESKVILPENIIIRDLQPLHPAFRNKIILLFIEAKKQGIDLVISETYRTPERQNMLYKMKLTKAKSGKSKHQYGLAIDIIPVINGVSHSDNKETLKRVGIIGEKLGLKWGGRWKFYDPVHFEYDWKINDAKMGIMPEIPDTILIPDINLFYSNIVKSNIE